MKREHRHTVSSEKDGRVPAESDALRVIADLPLSRLLAPGADWLQQTDYALCKSVFTEHDVRVGNRGDLFQEIQFT